MEYKDLRLSKSLTDFLKLSCAILVLSHHYAKYLFHNGVDNTLIRILSTHGGFIGVAVFFFISGYGLMESEKRKHMTVSSFISKRISKVYIPAVLVSIIWIVCCNVLDYSILPPRLMSGGLIYYLYLVLIDFGDPILWFVKIIFLCYISFYVFTTIGNEKKRIYILLSLTILITFITKLIIGAWAAISVPMFAGGVLCSCIPRQKIIGIYNHSLYLLFMVLIGVFIAGFVYTYHIVINCLIIYTIIYISPNITMGFQLPGILGNISYDVYLVHGKILAVMEYFKMEDLLIFIMATIIASFGGYYIRDFLLSSFDKLRIVRA